MALVQSPITVPVRPALSTAAPTSRVCGSLTGHVYLQFSGPADASLANGHSLLDMLVQASQLPAYAGPLVNRKLVPYFGSSEPGVGFSASGKTPVRYHLVTGFDSLWLCDLLG